MQNRVVLEQKIEDEPLSDRTSQARASSSRSSPSSRRRSIPSSSRSRGAASARPRAGTVDAIVGFANIAGFLRETGAQSGRSDAERRQELRRHDGARGVRARRATKPDRSDELARRVASRVRGARRPVGGEGRQRRPASGCIAPMSDRQRPSRSARSPRSAPHGQPRWTLGIVRRMKRLDDGPRRDRPAGDRERRSPAST